MGRRSLPSATNITAAAAPAEETEIKIKIKIETRTSSSTTTAITSTSITTAERTGPKPRRKWRQMAMAQLGFHPTARISTEFRWKPKKKAESELLGFLTREATGKRKRKEKLSKGKSILNR
jgi:hypothetical protein